MTATLEILSCPAPASVQDLGRPGYRHLGVPLSGALDPHWLQIANALVANPPGAAGLEMRLAGPHLLAREDCVFAIAGDVDARLLDGNGSRPVAAWRSHRLRAGEQVRVAAVKSGVAYLALAGGIAATALLGSRSSYLRAGLGEEVLPGTLLKVGAGGTVILQRMVPPPSPAVDTLRVMAGPQRDHFVDAAWENLLGAEFEVSREADRMGLRLRGPRLAHVTPESADIVSDAVSPGAIQVPGDGSAIVLLADGQTVGGYPKIAVVIGADLRRLGHLLPGQRLRFSAVSLDDALAARRQAARELSLQLQGVTPVREEPDLQALYSANLIDGVVNADACD